MRSLDDILSDMIETKVERAIRNTCYFLPENIADAVMRKLEEREFTVKSNVESKKLECYHEYLNKREKELQEMEERLNRRQAELDELESKTTIRETKLVTNLAHKD